MNKVNSFILLIVLVSLNQLLQAQSKEIDSLLSIVDTAEHDTFKLKALDDLAWKFMYTNPDSALAISKTALSMALKSSFEKFKFPPYNNIATNFAIRGRFDSSMWYYHKAKKMAMKTGQTKEVAMVENNIGLVFWNQGKLDSAIYAYQLALEQYKSLRGKSRDMANTLNNLGLLFMDRGKFDQALKNFNEAISLYDSLDSKGRGLANTYNNIGNIYKSQGSYPNALDYYLRALKVLEEENDQSDGYANVLMNIGIIYENQEDKEKALEYYNKARRAFEAISDQSVGLTTLLNNIGNIYKSDKEYEEALEYYHKALSMQKKMGEKSKGTSESYLNIANVQEIQKNYSEAEKNYQKALSIQQSIEDQNGISNSLQYLGAFYIKQDRYQKGIDYCNKSYDIAKKIGTLELEIKACNCLSKGFEKIGNHREALKYFKLYVENTENLLSKENTRAITQKAMQYEFDKIQYQDSLNRAAEEKKKELLQTEKDLKKEAEIERQKTYTIMGGVGFIFMLGLAFVLFRGYQNKQKANEIITAQKEEVEEQNAIIEEKNTEILDSINYAKRIQNIILPSPKTLSDLLDDSFVLFQPKDIVSGDFYWLDYREDYIFFAVIDCTGHGVPGALVSFVGHNSLNRVLNEFNIVDPAKMLDKLNEIVEDTFSQTKDSIKDGMDLALCRLNRKTNELVYAGANNPLYLVRNEKNSQLSLSENAKLSHTNKANYSLFEIKADKQPIGKYEYRTNFHNHSMILAKDDCVYIFSDGFADQFGGEKGKKFMYKPFKRLLTDLAPMKMKKQEKKLFYSFDEWKGEVEQIDDMCVMGVRI